MKIKRNLSACCFLSAVFFAIFLREGGHPSASLLSSWHTEAYTVDVLDIDGVLSLLAARVIFTQFG
jgi:hypothetical protein